MTNTECDILVVGGGTGGSAAALAAASLGLRVILTEPTSWVGGQLTSQLVPPDEHPWIERFGCTARYRDYRNRVRAWYAPQLTDEARQNPTLNPGGGWVSRLCHLPHVGHQVLASMLSEASQHLTILCGTHPVAADTQSDSVQSVQLQTSTGPVSVTAKVFLDATELGDLLPLAGAEYRSGAESREEFGEPHATENAEPDNVQAFTWCFLLSHESGADHTIPKPDNYARWRDFIPVGWPGPQLSFTFPNPVDLRPRTLPLFGPDWATLFTYRQVDRPEIYADPTGHIPTTCVNWPQNDAFVGNVIDVDSATVGDRLAAAKELNLSLLYWLQTEAGYPGLFLRPDLTGTSDGMAMAPYFRESRRMVTRLTVSEPMIAADLNPGVDRAPEMPKSIGVGHYRIDLHPSANGRGYIDIPSLPFQIPLGALIPVRMRNLLPACKNLGVTHITNGCYRLHPVEWNIGEAAGLLAAFCVTRQIEPAEVYESENLWAEFEALVHAQGIETAWPNEDLTLPS